MLKCDKNGFIELIKENGHDPLSFKRYEKDDVEGFPAFIIQLKNSPLFFMVRTNNSSFHEHDARYIEFAPGFPKSDYFPGHDWTSMTEVYGWFENWLEFHVNSYIREIDALDLWEQLEGSVLFDSDPIRSRNTDSFSKPEKERIIGALDRFVGLIDAEFDPSDHQREIIEDRLNYLKDGMDRLNKVDWQAIAVSTVISISIALSLDTDNGKKLFDLFKQAFSVALDLLRTGQLN